MLLPPEVWLYIMEQLVAEPHSEALRALASLAGTCTTLRALANHTPALYRQLPVQSSVHTVPALRFYNALHYSQQRLMQYTWHGGPDHEHMVQAKREFQLLNRWKGVI